MLKNYEALHSGVGAEDASADGEEAAEGAAEPEAEPATEPKAEPATEPAVEGVYISNFDSVSTEGNR